MSDETTRLQVPLSACVSTGDRVRFNGGQAYVPCKNGDCQILEPYCEKVTLKLGQERLDAVIKEITDFDEHQAYKSLSNYHYRGHEIFGRTSRLAIRLFHRSYPTLIGFIELASPFYMSKPRTIIVDTPFRCNGTQWAAWDKETHRKNIHLFVRIARVVVSPEFRGLGLATVLVEHALNFARTRWQVSGIIPYFIEISADMLKYVPFAEKAGLTFVGETEGNSQRVYKDMSYLLTRFGKGKNGLSDFESSCGICDKQASRLASAKRVMKSKGWNKTEFLQALESLTFRPTIKHLLLFGDIISLPKPHYMSGLNPEADEFIKKRALSVPMRTRTHSSVTTLRKLSENIELYKVSVSYLSKVARTGRTFSVQQAFNLNLDAVETRIIESLSVSIEPGQIVLIEGPSGSGKSTLLGLLSDLKSASKACKVSGKIVIPRHASLGTFQPIRSKKPLIEIFGEESVEHGIAILGQAGLSEAFIYLKRFSELSVGQQYRAMLAKMMTKDYNVWLADEFCTNLDPVTSAIVAHNVQRVARAHGVTLIVAASHSTHFMSSLSPDLVVRLTSAADWHVDSPRVENLQTMNDKSSVRTLLISSHYLEQIMQKRKTMTIRRGHLNLSPGPLMLKSGNKQVLVRCVDVRYKRFGDLSEEDARYDGFRSTRALKKALLQFYPGLDDASELTLIIISMNTGIITSDSGKEPSITGRGKGNGQL